MTHAHFDHLGFAARARRQRASTSSTICHMLGRPASSKVTPSSSSTT
ncbi:hypothetical protein [Rhodococcus sp. CX]